MMAGVPRPPLLPFTLHISVLGCVFPVDPEPCPRRAARYDPTLMRGWKSGKWV